MNNKLKELLFRPNIGIYRLFLFAYLHDICVALCVANVFVSNAS